MLTFPAHSFFVLRAKAGGQGASFNAASFATAVGVPLLALGQARDAGKRAAMRELEVRVAASLARGQEVAIDTTGMRKEEVGHLRNLAKRAYFSVREVDLDEIAAPEGATLRVTRVFPECWRPWLRGPFDVIGDIHDCAEELIELCEKLGYRLSGGTTRAGALPELAHPAGRRLVFVGDFTDRGPLPVASLRIVRGAAQSGALAVLGNHDKRLYEFLSGRHVSETDWFTETARAMTSLDADERREIADFLGNLPSHLVLDDGRLVVAHAGCRTAMQGRANEYVDEFCMYGESGGALDKDGYPIRIDWAADYEGSATVVYGHVTTPRPRWNEAGNAVCIDTGCCLGGALTALRWPERTLVSVAARRAYTRLSGFPRGARRGAA